MADGNYLDNANKRYLCRSKFYRPISFLATRKAFNNERTKTPQ